MMTKRLQIVLIFGVYHSSIFLIFAVDAGVLKYNIVCSYGHNSILEENGQRKSISACSEFVNKILLAINIVLC